VELHAPKTPEAVERGRYLANSIAMCVACHSECDEGQPGDPVTPGGELQGRLFPMKGFPGVVRAPNLTPDLQGGLGAWTDGEIVRAMREGVSRDGRPLFPMMPYRMFAETLSDDDALAIVAYLRAQRPSPRNIGHTELRFPISMLVRTAPEPLTAPPAAEPQEELARGRWLLKVGNCHSCHDTHDGRHEPLPGRALAGGDAFPMPDGSTIYAANISSDAATGVGAYSEEDLEHALSEGVSKAGRPLYFMPFTMFRNLTAEDRHALIRALRQERAVLNAVPARAAAAQLAQGR
jgi:cytochrome c553